MSGFMNDELEKIRNNLRCGHCDAVFVGSESQSRKVKYEDKVVYCSPSCRKISLSSKFSKPVPNRGPCGTCGKEFFSRSAKQFCGMECYINSRQFSSNLAVLAEKSKSKTPNRMKASEARRTGELKSCLECGNEFYVKKSRPSKFCSKTCYRGFMSSRFDRYVANPETIALPQCYDEFLNSEELSCLVPGCEWHGANLSVHMNLAHGIRRRDFKRAAGFNIGSGIISRPLAERLRDRDNVGVALESKRIQQGEVRQSLHIIRYVSKESKEHILKSRAISGVGPERTCSGCGNRFRQTTPFGRALYCSPICRDAKYASRNSEKAKLRIRQLDGTFRWMDPIDPVNNPKK